MSASEPTPHDSPRRFLLDGEAVELELLLDDNREGLFPEELDAIRSMRPGDSITFGGGAWASFVVACVLDEAGAA